MAEVSDALAALAALLEDIDPAPQPVPANIYVWPDDFPGDGNANTVDFSTFPFVIVEQIVNRFFAWRPVSQGLGQHSWVAGINVMLASGSGGMARATAMQVAQAKHEAWLKALAAILFNNRGLNGTAIDVGNNSGLFTYRVGNLAWDRNHVFWGVRVELPVMQLHSLPLG